MCLKLPTSEVVDYAVCKVDKQYLYPIGSYVHILFDITYPGEWMAYCHIAEQSALGVMMSSKLQGSSMLRKVEQ